MTSKRTSETLERQDPLIERYKIEPEAAKIVDRAITCGGTVEKPFHGTVFIGQENIGAEVEFGIHKAVGGFSDKLNPGDMLCAALAACLDSTIRIIASRFGVKLKCLEVEVRGEVDVRGTLRVDKTIPIGFQKIICDVRIKPSAMTPGFVIKKLVAGAEKSCVNLQTVLGGIEVHTNLDVRRF